MDTNSNTSVQNKNLKDYGAEIEHLTIADLEKETGKTKRAIKTHLTLNRIKCKDYDGISRKAEAEVERKIKREAAMELHKDAELAYKKMPLKNNLENTISATDAIKQNEKESESIFSLVSGFFVILWLGLSFWGFSANGPAFFLFWLALSFALFMAALMTWSSISDRAEANRVKSMSLKEQDNYKEIKQTIRKIQSETSERYAILSRYGAISPNLICPHCQTKGQVRSKSTQEVTSTKVIPIVGNNIKSRKDVTQMHCDNCSATWNI